ncbi:MAG: DUF1588 domain-containing protein [Verrucomicrobiota bacterium]
MKPPPVAIEFKDDHFDPNLTMREKVTQLTRDKACMACHSTINPLGFSLENYDAVGRWRETEANRKPVDAESDFETGTGETIRLRNARDVAAYALANPSAHRAFVTHLFHHLIKQPSAAFGEGTLENLRHSFQNSGFHIQNLMIEMATLSASQPNGAGHHRNQTASTH